MKTIGCILTICLSFLILTFTGCKKLKPWFYEPEKIPPVANAGVDQLISKYADSVTLNGTLSFDEDGIIVIWQWEKLSGPTSFQIINATDSITKIKKLVTGSYQFTLTVTDNDGLQSTDTVNILVDSVNVRNYKPIAKAGDDTVIVLPGKLVLDGSGSRDQEDSITNYNWSIISGPAGAGLEQATGIVTGVKDLAVGDYYFELKVTDAAGLFDTDTVFVKVRAAPILPPVAVTENTRTIQYDLMNCRMVPGELKLDGSASNDPDGTIVEYKWSLIDNKNKWAEFVNEQSAIASVTGLVTGSYKFKLEVVDNEGLKDSDTLTVKVDYINRPEIKARLIPIGNLSETRKVSTGIGINNKLFFAGGQTPPAGPGPAYSNVVDIYDISTDIWTTQNLINPRNGIASVYTGTQLYFAGGLAGSGLSTDIDVYDINSGSWSTRQLKNGGAFMTAIFAGGKVLFAGNTTVQILNPGSGQWVVNTLSPSRYQTSGIRIPGSLGSPDVVYLAGGSSGMFNGSSYDQVDIYNAVSGNWSTGQLTEKAYRMAGFYIRSAGIIYAGGKRSGRNSNKIDFFTNGSTPSCLFQPNSFDVQSVGVSGGKFVIFIGDGEVKNKFDVFDPLTNSWYVGVLDNAISPSVVVTMNNEIYIAGGYEGETFYNRVWKLELN